MCLCFVSDLRAVVIKKVWYMVMLVALQSVYGIAC